MITARIDEDVAEYLRNNNGTSEATDHATHMRLRHTPTSASGASMPYLEFSCATIEEALRVRASLCETALAIREFNHDLSDRFLIAERAIANAMLRDHQYRANSGNAAGQGEETAKPRESSDQSVSVLDAISQGLRPIYAEFRRLKADLADLAQRVEATRQEIRTLLLARLAASVRPKQ